MDSGPENKLEDEEEMTEVREMKIVPLQLIEVDESKSIRLQTDRGVHSVYPMAITQSSSKSKYYKQTYRPAWEQMPDFKGWLTGVEGQPRRAYCTYCQKTLHAHRLSLLKHTCTIRHQRAAQAHTVRRRKQGSKPLTHEQTVQTVFVSDGDELRQDSADDQEEVHVVQYSENDFDNLDGSIMDEHDEENEHEINEISDIDEEDEAPVIYETLSVDVNDVKQMVNNSHFKKQTTSYDSSNVLGPISTQVIDTTRGTPATGLSVSLYRLIDGRWTYINEGLTNVYGKLGSFMDKNNLVLGRYKLHYDVDRYFESRAVDSVFPFIEVVFDTTSISENYHFPLLLSPNSYTSYRGSNN